ncbi:hypothetical protein DYB30_003735 [Aphanomyces astaci]|uniref:Uncharacterized protein n=1 Tax=Aphanomyces astaci TaxID=112090 RepID=A0A397DYM5_APHAT|nr:hypothetical protein DYB30_003735 [Aphanomyces astaci]
MKLFANRYKVHRRLTQMLPGQVVTRNHVQVSSLVYDEPPSKHTRYKVGGVLYLLLTATGSVLYLVVVSPSMSNDYWWPRFNTTSTQTFIADLYNFLLTTPTTGPFDLFSTTSMIRKDYSSSSTFIGMHSSAARAILLRPLALDAVVPILRSVDLFENMRTMPPPCWLDFNRTFEMAHTARHQVLCNDRRQSNAALYLETLLRNVDSTDLSSSLYLDPLQSTIFHVVEAISVDGVRWMARTVNHTWLPVAQEVALWQAHGLSYFQNQLQNLFHEGLRNTMTIVSALGMRGYVTIHNIPFENRPKGAWSTGYAYCGFWNDLEAGAWTATSLIRSAPNAFEVMGNDWDEYYCGTSGNVATALIRSNLGPLTTIDIYLVSLPPVLTALYATFLNQLHNTVMLQPQAYMQLTEPTLEVLPATWKHQDAVYYGGNPMCCYGNPMPYVQPSFGYYDDCGTQDRHEINMARDSVLFAMFATVMTSSDQLTSVCALTTGPAMFTSCMQSLLPASAVFTTLLKAPLEALRPQLTQTSQTIAGLNVSFIQWATIAGVDQVLHQPMITSSSTSSWSFIGWMTMFDWANGQREVYSFQGDLNTYVLMSRPNPPLQLTANAGEFPHSACAYVWVVCSYISVVLLGVIGLVLVYSAWSGFHIDGRNLRRPLWQTLVLAGEVSWITYVLNDILLPWTRPFSSQYSYLSSLLTWVSAIYIESASPYMAQATVSTNCSIVSFMRGLECTSGDIRIGSLQRTGVLLLIVGTSTVVSYVGVALASKLGAARHTYQVPPNVLLASTSEAFLAHPVNNFSSLDAAACVMSGILPYGNSLFDIKIWVTFQAKLIGPLTYCLLPASLDIRPLEPGEAKRRRRAFHTPTQPKSPFNIRTVGLLGLFYMVGAVGLSFIFLSISRTTLENDFVWVGFKQAKVQVFLSNWFNLNLQMASPTLNFQVNSGGYGDYATTNNSTKLNVLSSALYAIAIQDEVNTLANVVRGLRQMDSCLLPWIATAYCFADLGRVYEMAHSATRQVRCHQNQVSNGAVYLETVFGNAHWVPLNECWGAALDVGMFSSLRMTNDGATWVQSIQSNGRSESDEVQWWQRHNITRFTTQWQNYKHLGMTESFLVSNAIGLQYPLTLKKTKTSFHIPAATAFKMNWSFANDLTGVLMANGSSILAGKSLLRQSATYAFVNSTMESAMVEQETLPSPLDPALTQFERDIGPFGVVDMARVACPQLLLDYYRSLYRTLLGKVSSGDDAIQSAFWTMYTYSMYSASPARWDTKRLWGGDINCGVNYGGWATAPFQYFSSNGICGNFLTDYQGVATANSIMATMSMASLAMEFPDLHLIGNRDSVNSDTIVQALNASLVFAMMYYTPAELAQQRSNAQVVQVHIRDVVQLELVQYMSDDGDAAPMELSRVNVFDPTEPNFEYFAWLYLFDWVEGKREVVTFQGDVGQVTTISTVQNYIERPVDAQEVPVNASLYFMLLIQYITVALCGVGCLVCVYIVTNRGYIEGVNMMSFSLVAGHVWIGRPFMLLRGLTAICFLSTAKLNLVRPHDGLVSFFDSPDRSWLMTLLSSGEMAWLVNVIHDTFSVLTKQYTAGCFSKSALIVCVSAAMWSFAAPTKHSVSISRNCHVPAVDFEVECVSGVVQIGDFGRFCGLIGLAFGTCLGTYAVERHRLSKLQQPTSHWLSFFLYSAAKHKFERTIQRNWEHDGVYYLDKASAALTGVLSVEYRGALYILDIKTWRGYVISPDQLAARGVNLPPHLLHAIPLVE